MVVDKELALASSLHAGPGTFALLVGSGISATAGVPTGWEVTLSLVERLATLQGDPPPDDPFAWYSDREGGEPDYSHLLAQLAPSPAERRNLLEPYFEPTDEEREQRLKQPTDAHRAIATLASKGYVRVIVTTNFDRLLEKALIDAGINPVVIATTADIAGAPPLVHSRCTVIKVHGDYLSPDLRNTVEELASYDPAMDSLLDRVFDEYGLLICGWSGVWDSGLRNAILRAPSRRYPTYWAQRGPMDPIAQKLVANRQAEPFEISGADEFFTELLDRVEALELEMDQQPSSTAMAVGQLKRYLPDAMYRIRLADLVMNEVHRVRQRCNGLTMQGSIGDDLLRRRLRHYEDASATLITLLANGAFYGDRPEHDELWTRALDRLAQIPVVAEGTRFLLRAQRYPVCLALYSLGLGAVASGRLQGFGLAAKTVMIREGNQEVPASVQAGSWTVLDHDVIQQTFDELRQHRTPISDYLHGRLRPVFAGLIPDDAQYDDIFDRVEYVLGLLYAEWRGDGIGPPGRFAWRRAHTPATDPQRITEGTGLLDAGLFDSATSLQQVHLAYERHLGQYGPWL